MCTQSTCCNSTLLLCRWKPVLQGSKKHFEQRCDDKFLVTCSDGFGEAASAYIWHGGEGFFAAWHVQFVELEHTTSNRLWRFHVDDWVKKAASADDAMSFVAQVCPVWIVTDAIPCD